MLFGPVLDGLELRRAGDGSARLAGRFPYGVAAVLGAAAGRERREVFAPRSLEPGADVHLLSQHDFTRPLASTRAGSLQLRQGDDGLGFEATIPASVAGTSYGRDALALIEAGMATGLSPGFRVPAGGDEVRAEGDAILRTVRRAELVELSIVTRPAFDQAQVEARSWRPDPVGPGSPLPFRRWRL